MASTRNPVFLSRKTVGELGATIDEQLKEFGGEGRARVIRWRGGNDAWDAGILGS